MSAVAVAIGAVVVGGGLSYLAAKEQSKAQKKAQEANLQQARDQQELERAIFLQSRGAEGSSLYPLYFADDYSGAQTFETQMFNYARETFDAINQLPPEERAAAFEEAAARFNLTEQEALDFASGVFSGDVLGEELQAIQPVREARTALAEGEAQAAEEARLATINRIQADARRKGFTGDTAGVNYLDYEARRKGAADAARARGLANLESAEQEAGLRLGDVNRRLSNLTLPATLRQLSLQGMTAGEDYAVNQAKKNLGLFDQFRIGPSSYSPTPLPMQQPIPTSAGLAFQAGAGVASGIGGSLTNLAIARSLQPQPSVSPNPPSGTTFYTDPYTGYSSAYAPGAAPPRF